MEYSNYKRNEILELKNNKDLFAVLCYLDSYSDKKAYWSDIFKGYKLFSLNKDLGNNKKFFKEEDIVDLEKNYGFNINHIDSGGNNLLLYVTSLSKRTQDSYCFDFCLDYIFKNTENVYLVNNYDENLLFNYCNYQTCGVRGEDFFKLIEKYPDFNYKQSNKMGRNILFENLIHTAPAEVIQFYMDKNVDVSAIDNEGYSILYFLTKYAHNYDTVYKKLFSKVFESIENIAQKNKHGNSFLEELYLFFKNEKSFTGSRENCKKWMILSLEKIARKEFNFNEESCNQILLFLEQYEYLQNVDKRSYLEAKYVLKKELLEMKLPIGEDKNYKKLKV